MRYISTPKKAKRKKVRATGRGEHEAVKFIKKQLINKNGSVCALCGQPIIDMKDCTIDHIVPVSKGGLTTIDNCQLAHSDCNVKKGDKYEQ